MLDSGVLTPSRGKKGSSSNLSTGKSEINSHLQKTNNLSIYDRYVSWELKSIKINLRSFALKILLILQRFLKRKQSNKKEEYHKYIVLDQFSFRVNSQEISDFFTSCCVTSAFLRRNTLIGNSLLDVAQ